MGDLSEEKDLKAGGWRTRQGAEAQRFEIRYAKGGDYEACRMQALSVPHKKQGEYCVAVVLLPNSEVDLVR